MSFHPGHLVVVLLPLVAAATVAATEPLSEGASTPPASPPLVAETIVPEIPVEPAAVRTYEPFHTQSTAPASPADRAGLETVSQDSAAPRTLTPGQLAKLARARAAIERARAAGTYKVLNPPDLDLGPPLSIEAIEEMKLQKLRGQQPLPYGPVDDTAGPGEVE